MEDEKGAKRRDNVTSCHLPLFTAIIRNFFSVNHGLFTKLVSVRDSEFILYVLYLGSSALRGKEFRRKPKVSRQTVNGIPTYIPMKPDILF
jgi:hypothetical protein